MATRFCGTNQKRCELLANLGWARSSLVLELTYRATASPQRLEPARSRLRLPDTPALGSATFHPGSTAGCQYFGNAAITMHKRGAWGQKRSDVQLISLTQVEILVLEAE
jgi:hypothetical protein